jgi:hypothetical protein
MVASNPISRSRARPSARHLFVFLKVPLCNAVPIPPLEVDLEAR